MTIFLVFATAITSKSYASFPGCSSSMMSMGMGMGNGMFNMMSGMPFFGGMARGMKRGMMTGMFSNVLNDPPQTVSFMNCAFSNGTLIDLMLETLDASPWILDKMAFMARDYIPFTITFTRLALHGRSINNFTFMNLNPMLYDHLTYSMLESKEITRNFAMLFTYNAPYYFRDRTRLVDLMYYLGTEENGYIRISQHKKTSLA